MALQDIIVHIDNSNGCQKRLNAAIALAQAHQAHITGVYNIPPAYLPRYAAAEIPFDIRKKEAEAAAEQAKKAGKIFQETVDREGLRSEWRVSEGDFVTNLCIHARYTDLMVLGQHDERDSNDSDFAPDDVILRCGRPVLLVPFIGPQETLGKRVMVAWNGAREAVRAVNDALPILQKADKVEVVTVNIKTDGNSDNQIPGVDIAHHLARHGVNATASAMEGVNINIGDTLLSHASDMSADLVIMGAYGHSRLRELIMGGATRSLLHQMTIPVLMSH